MRGLSIDYFCSYNIPHVVNDKCYLFAITCDSCTEPKLSSDYTNYAKFFEKSFEQRACADQDSTIAVYVAFCKFILTRMGARWADFDINYFFDGIDYSWSMLCVRMKELNTDYLLFF